MNRMADLGVGALTTHELLAIAISKVPEDVDDALEIGAKLVRLCGQSISQVPKISVNSWKEIGLSDFDIARIIALMEIGRRSAEGGRGDNLIIDEPIKAFELCKDLINATQEHFVILLLDTKNQLIQRVPLHKGTINSSIVGIKEIFTEAVKFGAVSFIAVHNHPSGDPTPSQEDINVTRRIQEAGKLLEINLLDHVIIGHQKFASLQSLGLM